MLADVSLGWKALCCITMADHCVTDLLVFLPHMFFSEDILKPKNSGFDFQMSESLYEGMLPPLPDAMIRFILEAAVNIIVAHPGYTTVLAHTAVLRLSESAWFNSFVQAGAVMDINQTMCVMCHPRIPARETILARIFVLAMR